MIAARRRWTSWLMLAPYLLLTAVFFVYPFLDALLLSAQQTNGPLSRVWVGLDNFAFVFGDAVFWHALLNTVVFAAGTLCIQLPLALGLALLLHDSRARLVPWLRLILFSPHLVGPLFVGILFAVLFAPRYGLINLGMQQLFGLPGRSFLDTDWLATPSLVMPAIILANLWMYVGYQMIFFLAALQNVDRSLIDAARIDGAGRWQLFRHITIPAIRPVLVFVVLTATIGSFQLFELPWTLLKQTTGPSDAGLTVVGYLYTRGFLAGDLGLAAAVGWVLALLVFVLALLQIRLGRGRED